ncbi:MAG TPA: creatininase family protein [Nitrospirae bacterium]|nr:creatinine amidohydrolase [bacterium BMS3Abin06]HDH12290.1 creatininase family protein [Nitrospirota bacterium]HDZ00797.1 creatininase family protein [Nitrospirota bacterium]
MILENITMPEFKKHLKKTRTIIFPFGTVEEHGNHLPLNTDTLIVNEILKRVVKKRTVFLAPPVYYGVCTTTSQHPGTISITPATLRRLAYDIVRDAYKKGLRNFFLITGHGGGLHSSAMKEAAENLVEELDGIKLAVICPYDILYKELSELAETPNDSHAGEIETSLVLSLAPELVKGRSKEEYPKLPKPFVVKNKIKYWRGGVWGNPQKASREKGERAIKLIVDKIVKIIDQAERVKSK